MITGLNANERWFVSTHVTDIKMGASSMAPYLSEAVKRSSQITAFSESYRFSWEKCEERGFLFRCIPSKYQEGKQGYQCEGLNIYLGRHAIFVKKYWNVDTNITQSYINSTNSRFCTIMFPPLFDLPCI